MIAMPSGNSGGSLRQRWTTNALSPSQSNSTSPPAPGTPMCHRPMSGSRRATDGGGVGGVMPTKDRPGREGSSGGVRRRPLTDPLAADRVVGRRGQRGDPAAGGLDLGLVVTAEQVVVLLAGGVRADDREAVAGRRAAMAGAGGEDEHVAGGDLERLALRPAELEGRAAGDDRERLVRGRVEVVEVED